MVHPHGLLALGGADGDEQRHEVILGGMGNFAGAIVGAFTFEYTLHVFKDITTRWQLLMGVFIVLVVVFAPRGLLGWMERLLSPRKPAVPEDDDA